MRLIKYQAMKTIRYIITQHSNEKFFNTTNTKVQHSSIPKFVPIFQP
jgi:hypothetical protein